MAVTALQNKEGLIISDGNSRINNRGLARRSRRGRRASAAKEEGEREREREVVRGSRGGDEGKGAGVVGGWFISAPQRSGSAYVPRASNYQLINSRSYLRPLFPLIFSFFVSPTFLPILRPRGVVPCTLARPFSPGSSIHHPPIHRGRQESSARLRRLVDGLRKVRLCLRII